MELLTIIPAQLAKFIGEQDVFRYVVKGVLWLLSTFVLAIGSFIALAFKWVVRQVKSHITVRETEIKVIKDKFEAINEYINETDKVQMIHTKVIGDIEEKTKILETKSERHGRLLAEHHTDIKTMKKERDAA